MVMQDSNISKKEYHSPKAWQWCRCKEPTWYLPSCAVPFSNTNWAVTKLCSFWAIFGRTTTFGKCCHWPTVGDTKYLWHLDIINIVIPLTPQEVEAGKANGIVLHFDGNKLVIKVHYHKYIYTNMATIPCPCPVLTAMIAYSQCNCFHCKSWCKYSTDWIIVSCWWYDIGNF